VIAADDEPRRSDERERRRCVDYGAPEDNLSEVGVSSGASRLLARHLPLPGAQCVSRSNIIVRPRVAQRTA
jgi:hypothetical protein